MDVSFSLLSSRVELNCFCAALHGEGPEAWDLLQPGEQDICGPKAGCFRFDVLGQLLADGTARILGKEVCDHALWDGSALATAITIPMMDDGKLLGGLVFGRTSNAKPFSSEDQHLLTAFSFLFAGKLIEVSQLEKMLRNERMAAIGNMASSIIHDVKNPLTSIQAFAELLGDFDFSPEERKEYAGLIVAQVRRMVGMVEDLLEFTRGGRSRYEIAPLPVAPFLQDLAQLMARDMAERGVVFTLAVDMGGAMLVDKDKLQRVLVNLAGNARDALAEGGRLSILASRADNMVHIRVEDNGPGIPEEIRDRLFEPFVTHGKKGGTGLGTAISKKIVEEMGGRIWFETASGRGTTFHIHLPLAG
jgi:signal transduction histidine kinase